MAPKLYDSILNVMDEKYCPTCGEQHWRLMDQQTLYCAKCHPEIMAELAEKQSKVGMPYFYSIMHNRRKQTP